MDEPRDQKMSVFVHTRNMKTVYTGERVQRWQISVHILVVECPQLCFRDFLDFNNLIFQFQFRFVKLKI